MRSVVSTYIIGQKDQSCRSQCLRFILICLLWISEVTKLPKWNLWSLFFYGFNQWMGSVPVCFTVPNFSSILQGSRSLKSMGTCFLTPTSNTSFLGRAQMFPVYVNSTFAVPEDLVHNVYWWGTICWKAVVDLSDFIVSQ